MEQPYVLGVDIGGQTAKCGIVNARGEVLAQTILVSNTQKDAPSFVGALASTLKKLMADAGLEGQVRGIGVGAPNGNYYTGEIKDAPNLTWAKSKNVPFASMLSEAMDGMPVALTNDANAAAVGEMTYGAARGLKDFIMITLGTGVGSGIVIGGNVLYGHDGFAGELGHTCAVRGGRVCGCGKQGCLEAYCSAIGVARTAVEWLEQHPEESSLLRLRENVTSKDVYEAAKAGDKAAKEAEDVHVGQRFHGQSHGVGDVVQLEVEEQLEAVVDDLLQERRAALRVKARADLDRVDDAGQHVHRLTGLAQGVQVERGKQRQRFAFSHKSNSSRVK